MVNIPWQRGATTYGRGNSAFLLTQIGASGDERSSSCLLAYSVSASIPGRVGHTSHSTHQHSPPSQVVVPCDAGIGGPPLTSDQRGIRAFHGLGLLDNSKPRRLPIYSGAAGHLPATIVPLQTPGGRRDEIQILERQLVRGRALARHVSLTVRPSSRPRNDSTGTVVRCMDPSPPTDTI